MFMQGSERAQPNTEAQKLRMALAAFLGRSTHGWASSVGMLAIQELAAAVEENTDAEQVWAATLGYAVICSCSAWFGDPQLLTLLTRAETALLQIVCCLACGQT